MFFFKAIVEAYKVLWPQVKHLPDKLLFNLASDFTTTKVAVMQNYVKVRTAK